MVENEFLTSQQRSTLIDIRNKLEGVLSEVSFSQVERTPINTALLLLEDALKKEMLYKE